MKNVLILGASGMVGRAVLDLCLDNPQINIVKTIGRKTLGIRHAKLKEIIHLDYLDYTMITEELKDIDTSYFCIGVYTGQVKDDVFKQITVDYAVVFAKALIANSPKAKLCLLSGSGADRTEKSSTAFARYKGMAENQISNLGLEFYSFRPGYIFPVIPRKEPNILYSISRFLYPLIKLMGNNASIKSTKLAEAMCIVGFHGADKEILENKDIVKLVK